MSENNEFENDNFFKGENEFEYYGSNQYIRPKREGFSVVSLICGLLSFFFGTMGIAGIVFGVLAVTASFLSRKKLKRFEKFSVIGLVLGIIGTVVGASILIAVFTLGAEFWDEYIKIFKQVVSEMESEV